jgi:ketol-acid reductoisomerase
VFRTLEIAFEELVAAGYPSEAVVMDLHGSGELGQVLVRAAQVGLYTMLHSDGSPACRYGVLTHRDTVANEPDLRAAARRIIARIRDGSFAQELIADQEAGHPRLRRLTESVQGLAFGEAEHRLRMALARDA